jgi:hypothetical protein
MLNQPVPSGCVLIRRTIGRFHVLIFDYLGAPIAMCQRDLHFLTEPRQSRP